MNPGFFAVQDALYEALRADAGVQALLGDPARLYDHVPPDAAFPFVTLGDMQAETFDTSDHDGIMQRVTLHVWSRQRGRQECKVILEALHDRLHHRTLSITGRQHVLTRFMAAETLLDDDGLTYHALAQYRVITRSVG